MDLFVWVDMDLMFHKLLYIISGKRYQAIVSVREDKFLCYIKMVYVHIGFPRTRVLE